MCYNASNDVFGVFMKSINAIKDENKLGRILYIIQATLEYFITTLAGGAYLAKLTTTIGIPDDVTAILSATVSLGVAFQLFALVIPRNKRAKRFVIPWSLVYQLLFTFMYLVPIFDLSREAKTAILLVILISCQIIQNVISSHKTTLFMSSVDEHRRGVFTAVKEITSLLSGVVFFYVIGVIVDTFEAAGNLTGAFITLGIVIFALTVLHTLSIILKKEPEIENADKKQESLAKQIKDVIGDKNLWRVMPVAILWAVGESISTPFYGTFQISDLGFTMVMVTVLSAVASVARVCFSIPFGKFADKYSCVKLLGLCYPIAAVGVLCNVFANGEIGIYLFSIYSILHSISQAGINGAAINLVYDAVPYEKRVGALALRGAVAGLLGFLSTLAVRPLVQYIQANGNSFLGMNVYAQQVLSAMSFIILIINIIYVNTALRKFKRVYD